jgi:hypothetical protein
LTKQRHTRRRPARSFRSNTAWRVPQHDRRNGPGANPRSLLAQLKELGFRLFREANYDDARLVFKKLVEMDKKDIISRFIYAQLIDDGTHNKFAESRDLLLSILDDHPDIFDRCSLVGPDRKGHRALSPAGPGFQHSAKIRSAGGYYAVQNQYSTRRAGDKV